MSSGEFDLIDRYFSALTPEDSSVTCGIGDDAAVLDIPAGQELLVAVDTLVEGVHFAPGTAAADIGYKSLAVNLSDIAAMGGSPRWATLALTLPAADEDWLLAFARGFAELARPLGISLIGGDTTRGPLSVSVQILGTAERGASLKRSGAGVGDLVYVSGCLGGAGLAYRLLQADPAHAGIPEACLQRLHRPQARHELGRCLAGLASAAIDISDGLAADLDHILCSSGVAAEVQLQRVPFDPALLALEDGEFARQLALAAGDDYELCFTVAADRVAELERRTGGLAYSLSCIGSITAGQGIHWLDENRQPVTLQLQAYRHF